MLHVKDLKKVDPIFDGLELLKEDIEAQEKVFCICAVAKDYHVGARDAAETFRRASQQIGRRILLEIHKGNWEDDDIYTPIQPSAAFAPSISAEVLRAQEQVQHAYEVLRLAHANYVPRKRLIEQDPIIRERLLLGFRRLRHLKILPVTTGNSAFNHQGLVMLLEQCFRSEAELVSYIRDPDVLQNHVESSFGLAQEERLFAAWQKRLLAAVLIDSEGMGLRIMAALSKAGSATALALAEFVGKQGEDMNKLAFTLAQLARCKMVTMDGEAFSLTTGGRMTLERIDRRNDVRLSQHDETLLTNDLR